MPGTPPSALPYSPSQLRLTAFRASIENENGLCDMRTTKSWPARRLRLRPLQLQLQLCLGFGLGCRLKLGHVRPLGMANAERQAVKIHAPDTDAHTNTYTERERGTQTCVSVHGLLYELRA